MPDVEGIYFTIMEFPTESELYLPAYPVSSTLKEYYEQSSLNIPYIF